MSDFRRTDFPNGSHLFTRPSTHSYHSHITDKGTAPRDSRIPGCSTFSKVANLSPEGLLVWTAKQTCAGVAELFAANGDIPQDGGELWGLLNRYGLTHRHARDKRAKEGTAVHELVLAALAAGEHIPSLADVTEDERGYAQGVMAWWSDAEPEPLMSEYPIYSERHGFAGTPDLLCLLDGRRTLIDLKTGTVMDGHHVQLCSYAMATEECGYGPVEDTLILRVFDNGEYATEPCAATEEDVLGTLAAYNAGRSIGRRRRENAKAAA